MTNSKTEPRILFLYQGPFMNQKTNHDTHELPHNSWYNPICEPIKVK